MRQWLQENKKEYEGKGMNLPESACAYRYTKETSMQMGIPVLF
jgi:hypothetical protein